MASNIDFEDEFWGVSENQGFQPPPPPTISEYNAKMSKNYNNSVFDTCIEENRIISGRGRGRAHFITNPGDDSMQNLYDYQDDEEIRKKIRETTGIGYSNSIIEEIHRNELAKKENNSSSSSLENCMIPKINLSSKVSPSTSSISSNDSSPRKVANDPIINTYGGNVGRIINYSALLEKRNNEIEQLQSTFDENGTSKPPPLSQMRRIAKLIHKKENTNITKENVNEKGHTWGTKKKEEVFRPAVQNKVENICEFWAKKQPLGKKEQQINIESHMDFPPL